MRCSTALLSQENLDLLLNLESAGISVVVASLNEGEYLRRTVESFHAHLPTAGEIIVVDDGSTDGSVDCLIRADLRATVLRAGERLGVARARNFGARHAKGEVLVFSDAHVEVPPDWAGPLQAALAQLEVGAVGPGISIMRPTPVESTGYGQRWRDATLDTAWLGLRGKYSYPVPLLGGGFIAMRRCTFEAIGGFDSGMMVWGAEDSELCIRLWTFGYECWVIPSVEVVHRFRPTYPYQVSWEPVLHNKLRLATVHFGPERLRRVVECLKQNSAFPAASARLTSSDVENRSWMIRSLRRYDDEWFFSKFKNELKSELCEGNSGSGPEHESSSKPGSGQAE